MSALSLARPPTFAWRRAAVVLLVTVIAHFWALEHLNRVLVAAVFQVPDEAAAIDARLLPPPPAAAPEPKPAAAPKPRPKPVRRPPPPAAIAETEPQAAPQVEVPPPTAAAEEAPAAGVEVPSPETAEAQTRDEPPAEQSQTAQSRPEPAAEEPAPVFEAMGPALEDALSALPDLRKTAAGTARYVYRTTNSEIRIATAKTLVEWTLGEDGRYAMRLSTQALGVTVLELLSEGRLRAFGLAPDRYTESRAHRTAGTANFDWEGRRVTFSSRPHERALIDGLQDRLSFQIQLMLLAQAQPQRFRQGALTLMLMAGRDDVALYRFRSAGGETIATGIGRLDAVRLERLTDHEYEARIEVWLVPAMGWLPARLRFTDRLGRVTESVLESIPAS